MSPRPTLSGEQWNHATQLGETAVPATQIVVHRPDPVNADCQLGIVIEDVAAHHFGRERRSVRGGTDRNAELPSEVLCQLAQRSPEQRLATHPTHEHSVTRSVLVLCEDGTEPCD